MSRRIFITGTDTGVGKTWLTTQAIGSLLDAGMHARAFKPVACGLDAKGMNEDISLLLEAQKLSDPDAIARYRFTMPAAPAQAAAAEGCSVDKDALLAWCEKTCAPFDVSLIEGVGGLMVPLTDAYLVSHWLADMPDCEVWLVVAARLGAINHALLTLTALRALGRPPAHIFVNATSTADEAWLQPTLRAILPHIDKSGKIHTLRHQMHLNFAALLAS
ncbi:MAG: dethiobiotin synthase [Mariprofundaceae bacterium]